MTVYIISPELTAYCQDFEEDFLKALRSELDNYISHDLIKNIDRIDEYNKAIRQEDLLIIFNGMKEFQIASRLLEFIENIQKQGTYIVPVALKKEYRPPISQIQFKQTFDVQEELRSRDFSNDYLEVIATIFARNEIISRVKPNIYSKKGLIFISHRRTDGEDLVAEFCDKLAVQYKHSNFFRDVTDVENVKSYL